MPLHPAVAPVRDQQHRCRACAEQLPTCDVDAAPRLGQRIGSLEFCDQLVVAGMQLVHLAHVALDQVALRLAERPATDMRDEYCRHGDVAPAEMPCPDAEVVLFAVALGEDVLAQHSRGVQAVALDVDAEPHRARNVDDPPGIRRVAERVQPCRLLQIRNCVFVLVAGIAQDRGVIRKRRRSADAWRRVGCLPQTLQPARRHQRIAVQQHHVARRIVAHADIGAGGKSQVRRIGVQRDAPLVCQLAKRFADVGVGRGIIHDVDACPTGKVRQHDSRHARVKSSAPYTGMTISTPRFRCEPVAGLPVTQARAASISGTEAEFGSQPGAGNSFATIVAAASALRRSIEGSSGLPLSSCPFSP